MGSYENDVFPYILPGILHLQRNLETMHSMFLLLVLFEITERKKERIDQFKPNIKVVTDEKLSFFCGC